MLDPSRVYRHDLDGLNDTAHLHLVDVIFMDPKKSVQKHKKSASEIKSVLEIKQRTLLYFGLNVAQYLKLNVTFTFTLAFKFIILYAVA